MDGSTLCPHCNTRFRIAEAQLEAHQGMVRCGHCLQAFDARPNFVPDVPSPQLDLPIPEEHAAPTEEHPPVESLTSYIDILAEAEVASELAAGQQEQPADATAPYAALHAEAAGATEEAAVSPEHADHAHHDSLDFSQPIPIPHHLLETQPEPAGQRPAESLVLQPKTLAEQVEIVPDGEVAETPAKRTWLWAVASLLLVAVMLAQAAYFLRVDLAARMPGLKPALESYCRMLNCSVPLPRKSDLMSIESSDLEANPVHQNQITLNALLRNRASFAQAFPSLELTLNDTQDKPLARRVFRPKDYLPAAENEKTGMLPNHELSIKIPLDTTDLKPSGYRLVLFYPQ